jgi:hypothetical protein
LQHNSRALSELIEKSEEHSKFFTHEFPGLIVEAVRRAETVRARSRIRRMASILAHSLETGPADGADYVEEMLRIATGLSDVDVKVLRTALDEFGVQLQHPAIDNLIRQRLESDVVVAARAWFTMKTGVLGDELASVGAKLQSFGLASRIEGHTGDSNSYRVLIRGRRFIDYVLKSD